MECMEEPDEDCEWGGEPCETKQCKPSKDTEVGGDGRENLCKSRHDPSCDSWVVHARRVQSMSEQSRGCGMLLFTILLLVLCLASFMFCQECLFGILIISACLCPFFHPLNAPLWLAIVLLTVGGWSFTTGALSISWKSNGI